MGGDTTISEVAGWLMMLVSKKMHRVTQSDVTASHQIHSHLMLIQFIGQSHPEIGTDAERAFVNRALQVFQAQHARVRFAHPELTDDPAEDTSDPAAVARVVSTSKELGGVLKAAEGGKWHISTLLELAELADAAAAESVEPFDPLRESVLDAFIQRTRARRSAAEEAEANLRARAEREARMAVLDAEHELAARRKRAAEVNRRAREYRSQVAHAGLLGGAARSFYLRAHPPPNSTEFPPSKVRRLG